MVSGRRMDILRGQIMCLSAADVNPLCDECFEKTQNTKIINGKEEEVKLCPSCEELMTRFCGCCDTVYDTKEEANLIDGVCKACRGD